MKVRNPEEIVLAENDADAEIKADATICCLDCDRNQSEWEAYQRGLTPAPGAIKTAVDGTSGITPPLKLA